MHETCDACAYPLEHHEAFRVLGEGTFCGRCWAERLALETQEDVAHIEVAPILVEDAAGEEHQFHFRYSPRASCLSIFELDDQRREAGYKFRVIAEEGEGSAALVGRLLAKARTALASPQLEPSKASRYPFSIKGEAVQGWIRSDPEAWAQGESIPRVSIDGRDLPWLEFGRMVMEHEGWPFRLEFLGDE